MTRALVLLSSAALALAASQALPGYKNRPTPKLNANPTNTSEPRLNGKSFPFNDIPELADTSGPQPNVNFRGPQAGYNKCNSSTEGPTSMCQTAVVNSINDWCLFAPSKPGALIADTEGEEVAWCTQPGHGTRVIPPGTFSAIQFIRTKSYVEITATLDQTMVDMHKGDAGGELDSGGQDGRGNPIGGLMYSNSLPSANGNYVESRAWHTFIGGNTVCIKLCDMTAPDAEGLCEHVYDTLGCNFNIPASYAANSFTSCLGDDQDPIGVYLVDGTATKWPSPGETGIPDPPYTPTIPASSMCQTFKSEELFGPGATIVPAPSGGGDAATVSTSASVSGSTSTASTSRTSSGAASGSASSTGSATGAPTATGSGAAFARAATGGVALPVLIAMAAVLVGATVFV